MTIAGQIPTKENFASKVRWALADARTVTWRNLIRYLRIPDAIFFSSVQPVMFVLLFRYVFGGAIHVTGVSYVDFLIAGVFVQSVSFGSIATAVGLADDLHTGLIERFRALPMARSAVLAGRTAADTLRNIIVLAILTGVGYAVGFRVHTTAGHIILAYVLVLFYAYAVSWGFAIIGLSASNAEAAQLAAFPILFPLTFASSAFVPVSSMPGWLQAFAVHQPVSQIADATRYLLIGGNAKLWGASNVWQSIAWCAGMFLVFAPLAVRKFRKIS